MRHWLLLLIAAIVVAGIAYTVVWIFTGGEEGLAPNEPDGRAVPLPGTRPLAEGDISAARFDTALRGYRMAQVDAALRRTAYDIGYKQELIDVLEAEVEALRAGRRSDADKLRAARLNALAGTATSERGGRHTVTDPIAEEPVDQPAGLDVWDGGEVLSDPVHVTVLEVDRATGIDSGNDTASGSDEDPDGKGAGTAAGEDASVEAASGR